MKSINNKKVKLKNILGLIDNPTYEDLLYEIVYFLDNEKRYDGVFNKFEVSLKTKCRISDEITTDLEFLENKGYIEKLKYTKYQIKKHLWE